MKIISTLFLLISILANCAGQSTKKAPDSLGTNKLTPPVHASLQEDLIRAQIDYYNKQSTDKSLWSQFLLALPTILGTFVGASLALFGVRWSSNRQWRLEEKKWDTAKADESKKEIRAAFAEFSRNMAAEVQAIQWLTWIGKNTPAALTLKEIDQYDTEIKILFKEDVVAQMHLSILDVRLYNQAKPLMIEIAHLDVQVSLITQKFKSAENSDARMTAASELGNLYDTASAYYNELPEKLGGLLT